MSPSEYITVSIPKILYEKVQQRIEGTGLAAQDIFDEFPNIDIVPLFFRSFSHCTKCGSVANEKICPHPPEHHINFSGTKIRQKLIEGKRPPTEQMRPEVADIILQYENPFVE